MLQSLYRRNLDIQELERLISIYKSPDRKTSYITKVKQIMNLIPQKQKINKEDFKNAILDEEIEIIY